MSASEFNEVLGQLPSHLREQAYTFAQFLLAQKSKGKVSAKSECWACTPER